MKGHNWTCPFCNRAQVITEGQFHLTHQHLFLKSHRYMSAALVVHAIACSNPECGEVVLDVNFGKDSHKDGQWRFVEPIDSFKLRPQGAYKPQPTCVPHPIAEDYYEACKIRDLSPKASATLSRRCLQGMIRDFCGITRARLIDEIKALEKAVSNGSGPVGVLPDAIEAIDHVRGIGNIGAHMEEDVNVIIPVESHEAQALIELLELLFEEWYVARDSRIRKLARVKEIGAEKKALKASKIVS